MGIKRFDKGRINAASGFMGIMAAAMGMGSLAGGPTSQGPRIQMRTAPNNPATLTESEAKQARKREKRLRQFISMGRKPHTP